LSTLLIAERDCIDAAHGEIACGCGSGFYAFRKNVLRGYVRLKAEIEGIELIPDPA
jgi:hypothetical protein